MDIEQFQCLEDFHQYAEKKLPKSSYDYVMGAAIYEHSLQNNLQALANVQVIHRVLRKIQDVDTSVQLFDRTHRLPLLVAPTAFHRLAHHRGELETLEGASAADVTCIFATLGSIDYEELANHNSYPKWFQMYFFKDTSITELLLEKIATLGFEALVVTIDIPISGRRVRDLHNQFQLPKGAIQKILQDLKITTPNLQGCLHDFINANLKHSIGWQDIEWLRKNTNLPILVKGILHPDDAVLAQDHGCSGVILSNHGGRQLDDHVSAVTVLPEVREHVGFDFPVLVDGGIRSGTDMIKVLALGASAALLGRPVYWALATGGAESVQHMLNLLHLELSQSMLICGAASIKQLNRNFIWRSKIFR